MKTLKYYAGNRSLGIDSAPKGEWKKGIFTLEEDTEGFKTGAKFLPNSEDLKENNCLNDGSGIWELEPFNNPE